MKREVVVVAGRVVEEMQYAGDPGRPLALTRARRENGIARPGVPMNSHHRSEFLGWAWLCQWSDPAHHVGTALARGRRRAGHYRVADHRAQRIDWNDPHAHHFRRRTRHIYDG